LTEEEEGNRHQATGNGQQAVDKGWPATWSESVFYGG